MGVGYLKSRGRLQMKYPGALNTLILPSFAYYLGIKSLVTLKLNGD